MEFDEAITRMDAAMRNLDADQKRELIEIALALKRLSKPSLLRSGPERPDLPATNRARSE